MGLLVILDIDAEIAARAARLAERRATEVARADAWRPGRLRPPTGEHSGDRRLAARADLRGPS